jgi:hypothetical protein
MKSTLNLETVLSLAVLFFSLSLDSVLSQEEGLNLKWVQQVVQVEDFNTRMGPEFDTSSCNLSKDQKDDIQSYRGVVQRIFSAATTPGSDFAGKTYRDLGTFVDKFGSRLSGSEALEKSIVYMKEQMGVSGFVDVHTENATVPKWIR